MAGIDASTSDFSGAKLNRAILEGATLDSALFNCSNLNFADVSSVRNPGHRGHSIRTIAGSLSGTSRAVCPGHCGQPVNIGDQHLWVI
jgi:uncharacterized protein YjbI with pentapeptide repeats